MARSGDEPAHARSLLGLRLTLAASGAVVALGGALLLWLVGHEALFAWMAASVGLLAIVNMAVVARHLRMGAHYQPGRGIPPYRPLPELPAGRTGRFAGSGQPVPARTRQRRYLILMGVCLFLITNAWVWVRLVSVTVAVGMSIVASVIPPIAAMVANAGWSTNEGPPRDDSNPPDTSPHRPGGPDSPSSPGNPPSA